MKTLELNTIARQLILEGRHDGLTKRQIKAERKAYVAKQYRTHGHYAREMFFGTARMFIQFATTSANMLCDDYVSRDCRRRTLTMLNREKRQAREYLAKIKTERINYEQTGRTYLWRPIGGDAPFTKS